MIIARGYLATEVTEAAQQAKNLSADPRDEFRHAPAYLKGLAETVKNLSTVLDDFAYVLQQYGDTIPQKNTFDEKLAECEIILEKYRGLQEKIPSDVNKSPNFATKFRQTFQHAL